MSPAHSSVALPGGRLAGITCVAGVGSMVCMRHRGEAEGWGMWSTLGGGGAGDWEVKVHRNMRLHPQTVEEDP